MTFHGNRRIAMSLVSIVLAALILIPLVGPTPPESQATCGVERWSVKTGTDPDAQLVDLTNIIETSIPEMAGWPRPGNLPPNNRIDPYETNAFWYYAFVVQYLRESDQDYHVVIQDYLGNYMIAEIPDPACVVNARAEFDAMFNVTTSRQYTHTPVMITGVGFFDFNHGQTGHALNYIELHPVLDIIFL
jgi:hypothetical protein